MKSSPPIKNYMIDHPYTIDYLASASSAEKIMNAHRIRHLPVVDGKTALGMISDRDVALARQRLKDKKFDGAVSVKEIGFEEDCIVDENEPLDVVARKLSRQKLDAVIVVRDKMVVGIFTAVDATRLLADLFHTHGETKGLWATLFG